MSRQVERAELSRCPRHTYENSEEIVMERGMFIIAILMAGIMGTARADI